MEQKIKRERENIETFGCNKIKRKEKKRKIRRKI